MKFSIFAGMGMFLLCQAASACEKVEKPAFSCTTTRGKVVSVCEAADSFGYQFGKPGLKPEMQLRVPRNAVIYANSQGASGYSASLGIPNANTVYTVSHDWYASDGASGALEVEVGGKIVATLDCRTDTLVDRLSELDLPNTDAP